MTKFLLVLLKLAGILILLALSFWSFGFAWSGISIGYMEPVFAWILGAFFVFLLIMIVRSLLKY